MDTNVAFVCGCLSEPRRPVRAVMDILEEVQEFIEEPSRDEFSDVMFTLGRFLAALRGKIYCRFPGDGLTVCKVIKRARETGCIRSLRHHPHGVCASTLTDG